jgi:NodT family efflux transporter outer membrane factor (OMF) lipoprotein
MKASSASAVPASDVPPASWPAVAGASSLTHSYGTAALLALVMVLTSCTVGPKYARPAAPAPITWSTQGPWQVAAPKDGLPKGAWWKIFGDDQLNGYEQQLLNANQSLTAAKDHLDQSRSFARIASAGYFPQLSADPSAYRERFSGNRPLQGALPKNVVPDTENVFAVPFSLSYEVDLFGRVRRTLEAANANLQASAADLQNVQLVLTAELAADYYSLRELDAEAVVVQESVDIQQKGLDLVNHRHEGGIANGLDVAQQASLLDATRTQLSLVEQQRAQFEHAIATLTGSPASSFHVPAIPQAGTVPAIPLGVPSGVLERRPDVAAAERDMAVKNAQVGIATAAFYPHITLSASGGYESRDITALINAPSAFWSIGADLLQPILEGGKNRATLAAAKSGYEESVANYRQAVLTSFQQVEDGLSGLNALTKASATQQAAVEDSRRALTIANNRYVGGITTYLDVITAQSTLLTNERLATQLQGQQMVTAVALVKALGGGWDAALLQQEQVHPQAGQLVQQ